MSALTGPGWYVRVGLALSRRPALWRPAVVAARRLAPQGWWRRFPFLPRPAAEYLAFRSLTMYGSPQRTPEVADVISYLRWCADR